MLVRYDLIVPQAEKRTMEEPDEQNALIEKGKISISHWAVREIQRLSVEFSLPIPTEKTGA